MVYTNISYEFYTFVSIKRKNNNNYNGNEDSA